MPRTAAASTRCLRLSLALAAVVTLLVAAGWLAPARAVTVTIQKGVDQGAANDPLGEVKTALDQVITVFKDRQLPLAERRRKLRDLAEQHFDFAQMARSALGYHWRNLTPDQRGQFVPLFAGFIEDAYLSKLQEYTVEKVQQEMRTTNVNFTGQKTLAPGYVEVQSDVILSNRPNPIHVNYLLKQEPGGWKIYDVTIDAISLIANYRNQFNRVINNDGYPKLVAELEAKRRELGGTLGK
ncbi:MAG: MlaC/ttg2D family ABC transporter substrate-binding protein [Candidatus Binataceae bacterium]